MNDAITIILDNLNIKEIIKCVLICHNYKFIIQNHHWINKTIKLTSANINYVMNNYNFKNIKIYNCDVDLYINKLKNCHTLDLSCTNITNESVKELKNCHTLNLSFCNKITDESVKELKKCHTLNLSDTNITDESVKELKNCHTLDLSGTNITDESVKELKNCHTLDLSGTNITDESVKELKNCHTLYLTDTNITDESVKKSPSLNLRNYGLKCQKNEHVNK
jgi:hypothetical protein